MLSSSKKEEDLHHFCNFCKLFEFMSFKYYLGRFPSKLVLSCSSKSRWPPKVVAGRTGGTGAVILRCSLTAKQLIIPVIVTFLFGTFKSPCHLYAF